jgi:hypothetical protein
LGNYVLQNRELRYVYSAPTVVKDSGNEAGFYGLGGGESKERVQNPGGKNLENTHLQERKEDGRRMEMIVIVPKGGLCC